MTEKRNIYNHSKIYKLLCDDGYYYIGCTTQTLTCRLGSHRRDSKKHNQRVVYDYILKLGWDRVKIVLISEHCFDNKEQLLRAETELIIMHKNDPLCLNTYRSKITIEEKKERIKEYDKQYYDINREHKNEYKREHYKKNIDIIREQKRIYREDNKDKMKEYRKEYYDKNRELILEQKRKTYDCICGVTITSNYKNKHENTKKHIDYINSQNEELCTNSNN